MPTNVNIINAVIIETIIAASEAMMNVRVIYSL